MNFYHVDSTLSGHTDHSERDLSHPLLSIRRDTPSIIVSSSHMKTSVIEVSICFSYGQSAVFLVGGERKSVSPQAIVLHSGDVLIMSGPSRLAYHGVPRIIAPSTPIPPALSRTSLLHHLERCRVGPCQLKSGVLCRVCETERELQLADGGKSSTDDTPARKRLKTEPETEVVKPEVVEPEVVKPEVVEPERSACEELSDVLREWTDFERYISTSRINVNIRQVNKAHRYSPIT